jgi:hypothetical protein
MGHCEFCNFGIRFYVLLALHTFVPFPSTRMYNLELELDTV